MPGKKAPDYFPLNLGMSGIGKSSGFYGNVSPAMIPTYGKFDTSGLGMIMTSPMNTLTNNSPNTATYSLSEYITLNGIPPVNSEDEDDDDIVSHSGSESVSIQDSDDLDVDIDDVDSLVLNIRDKLQMAPNAVQNGHWSSSGSLSSSNTPSDHHCASPLGFPNNGGNNESVGRRRRNHPYTHVRSMNFNHQSLRKSSSSIISSSGSSSTSNSTSNSSVNTKGHNSYYRRFHPNPPGSIAKNKSTSSHQKNWWATSVAKTSCSSSSLTKQFSRTDDPYQLLQDLLESGSLIKEAVRRLNRKCLNSSNGGNNSSNMQTAAVNCNSSSSSSNSSSNTSNASSVAGTTITSSSNTRFSYDEDTENSYPMRPYINHIA